VYVIMWEFVVRPERVSEFVSAYKADGIWAQLFGLAAGYKGTELLSSTADAQRFITIDRWDNVEDYVRFQEGFGPQYKALNARLEELTLRETKVGTFATY
jgi:heme-degrading monooxygenase HmoA